MRYLSLCFAVITLTVFTLSCSGSDALINVPVQPDYSAQNLSTVGERVSWGSWDIAIDTATNSVDIVPLRGADYMVNVVQFLQPPSASMHLLSIQIVPEGTSFAQGLVTCDVTIKHPLPGTMFCGFDVMGIVMDDHPASIPFGDPSIMLSLPPATLLQNADGWTRWWNQPEFTSCGTLFGYTEGALAHHGWISTHTLNAYKYFSDDLDAQDSFDPDPDARGFFSSTAPGSNARRYVLKFPVNGGPILHFKYAVSASYKPPLGGSVPPYTSDEFPPDANMPEAYKIRIIDSGSTAFYENSSSFGGDLELMVEVRDWQFSGDIGSVTDEIEAVTIVSPTLFTTPVHLDLAQASLAPGNPTAVWIPATIGNVTPTGVEDQLLLIAVKCTHPQTYEPQIPGGGAFAYPPGPLAAYAVLEAPVSEGEKTFAWPVYRQNLARTGRTDVIGPVTNNVKFVHSIPVGNWGVYGGMVVDSKDRVIFHTDSLYCLEPDGSLAWSYPINGNSYTTPSVGPDDSIYVGNSESQLFHIDKNGELLWMQEYDYYVIDGSITVQEDGTIIFGTWHDPLVKVDSMGNEIWTFETGGLCIPGGPAIGDDDTIYIATHDDHVYAVSQVGNQIWMTNCGNSDMCAPPALGPLGIYVGSMSGRMYCLNYNGSIKWYKQVSTGGGIHDAVAIGDDGNIYFGCRDGSVYCMAQAAATVIWEFETSHEIFATSPVLDGADHIYIGNVAGDFYCLTTGGDQVWVYSTGDMEIRCKSPAIASDGTVLVGTLGGLVYGFKDE